MTDISHATLPVRSEMEQVDATISEYLRSDSDVIVDIGNYITDDGKRFRPIVLLLSALACSYEGRAHIKFAAVIEFIHTATLLHDDVIDGADIRRSKKTVQNVWNSNASILTGDFLYSRAFQMLSEIGSLELINTMANATNIISEGEVQQLMNIGSRTVDESECLRIAEKKTAKLFEAACGGVAILAGSDTKCRDDMASFGLHFGLAFQLIDDLLDYVKGFGKRRGQDLLEGKPTLPFVHALQNCNDKDRQFLGDALGSDKVEEVIALMSAVGSLDYVRDKARSCISVAAQKLACLPPSSYRQSLEELLQLVIERDH